MKREDIKSILEKAGVTEENMKDALDSIFAENGKDIEAERTKVTEAKDKELKTANDTIESLQKTIKGFEGVDIDKLKKDAADLKKQYDTDIKAAQEQTKKLTMEYALKDSLREAGVLDADSVAQMCLVTVEALSDGPSALNGNVERAKIAAEEAKAEYEDFLKEVAVAQVAK